MIVRRQLSALAGILLVTLILTGAVAGKTTKSPLLIALAPILMLAFLTWYLILLIVNRNEIIAALAAILLAPRKEKPEKTNLLIAVVAYAFFVGVTILFLSSGLPQRILGVLQGITMTPGTGGQVLPQPQINPISGLFPTAPIVYYGISVFAAVFMVSLLILLLGVQTAFRNRGTISEEYETEIEAKEEAAEAVREAIVSLKGTKEYHEAILQCYKRMCEILSNAGIVISPAETAREFAANISAKLHLGTDAVRGLTLLFEEARYSDHQITDQSRIMALSHLESLQKALSTNAGLSS